MRSKAIIGIVSFLFIMITAVGIHAAKLSEDTLKKKKEGWYPTGLPLINFSSDEGIGYGLRGYLYYNGSREDKYFDTAPYFFQMYIQLFTTTLGRSYHELNVDMPYFLKTAFRVRTAFAYDENINANYFGLGAGVSDQKLTDSSGNTYDTYEDYESEFLKSNNNSNYKYNKYTYTKPTFFLNIYRDIGEYIKLLVGAEIKKVDIEPWDERRFELDGHKYTAGLTLLEDEQPLGYAGGWANFGRFGIGLDTRDYEPDPKRGFYLDYAYEIADGSLGSDYDFDRHTAAARIFLNPFSPVVFAFRGAYTDANGDIPFFEMNKFAFALNRRDGLGGNRTLRGFKQDRFVGPTMTMGNAEIRLSFAEIAGAGQRFEFKIIGFVESGNVYDKAGDPFNKPRWNEYKTSYGGGLVIAWNLATIIHAYYGVSAEDTGIFVNFEHNF